MRTVANGEKMEVVVPRLGSIQDMLVLLPSHAFQPLIPHRYLPANARSNLYYPKPLERQRVLEGLQLGVSLSLMARTVMAKISMIRSVVIMEEE